MASLLKSPSTASMQTKKGATITSTKGSEANVFSSNNVYLSWQFTGSNSARDDSLRLYSDSILGNFSDDKANRSTTYPTTDTTAAYGDATDTWGLVSGGGGLNATSVNDSSFGVYYSVGEYAFAIPPLQSYSSYLYASGFGFALPSQTQILGCQVGIERKAVYAARTNVTTITVDHITITLYYAGTFTGVQSVTGFSTITGMA